MHCIVVDPDETSGGGADDGARLAFSDAHPNAVRQNTRDDRGTDPRQAFQVLTHLFEIGAPHPCPGYIANHRCFDFVVGSAHGATCFDIAHFEEVGGSRGAITDETYQPKYRDHADPQRERNVTDKRSQARRHALTRFAIAPRGSLTGGRFRFADAGAVAHFLRYNLFSQGYCSSFSVGGSGLERQSSTSYSNSIPCSRLTRSRISSASASASSARAFSPSVTMKFA